MALECHVVGVGGCGSVERVAHLGRPSGRLMPPLGGSGAEGALSSGGGCAGRCVFAAEPGFGVNALGEGENSLVAACRRHLFLLFRCCPLKKDGVGGVPEDRKKQYGGCLDEDFFPWLTV